jgi:hypothetical protein
MSDGVMATCHSTLAEDAGASTLVATHCKGAPLYNACLLTNPSPQS